MILRRVIAHFRKQEWTAIAIDFLIVVIGVFVGLQVNNWNETRAARDSERTFLEAVRDDLIREADDTAGFLNTLTEVSANGARAIATLDDEEGCEGDCWRRLVDFFLASQWVNVRSDRAVFNEIQRTGLPRDRDLKAVLIRYYGLNDQVVTIFTDPPSRPEGRSTLIICSSRSASRKSKPVIKDC